MRVTKMIRKNFKDLRKIEEKEEYISIVMPVYNRSDFLEESIKSALAQDYENFELIIVDDGSTDLLVQKILKRYKRYKKVFLINKMFNEGPSAAMNTGAKFVKGSYFCRLDSDDKLTPDALKTLNRYIKHYPNVSYFYSSRYVIDESSDIKTTEIRPDGLHRSLAFNANLLPEQYHCNHLICWRRLDYLKVGGMREDIHWAEDWDLALRMSKSYDFQNIKEGLYFYRQFGKQSITCTLTDDQKNIYTDKFLKELTQ